MNTFTADGSLKLSLASCRGLTEVRDAQGAVLGYFSPASRELAEAYVAAASHFDPLEMKQRKASNEPGSTTSELLCRIERAAE